MIGSIVKALAGAVLGVVVLLHSPPAKADLFTWSYTGLHGYSVTAGGTFTATDDGCCGLFTVTSITGTWNGSPITLLPPNSYGFNDNKIRPLGAPDQLTFNGFAFSVAGEMDVFNVFYNYDTVNVWSCGFVGYCELHGPNGTGAEGDPSNPVAFQIAAVPGPIVGAGLPGLILAAGGMLACWRRRKAAA